MSHATLRALTPIALVLCLYAAERSQAQTAPRTPTITVSPNLRMIPGEHNEPWVAVSSNNPDIVIAAAQQGGGTGAAGLRAASTMISRDGGRSWVAVTLPRPSQTPFDVSVASGPNGRLYVMQGTIGGDFAAQLGGQVPARSMIRFWASADGGWTWDGPTELTSAVDQDHMRMTIDMSKGPHRGRVYVAWNDVADRFVRNQYEVFLQWSDDGGKTFTEPTLIDTRKDGKLVATEPVVLSDGTAARHLLPVLQPARSSRERAHADVRRAVRGRRQDVRAAGEGVRVRTARLALAHCGVLPGLHPSHCHGRHVIAQPVSGPHLHHVGRCTRRHVQHLVRTLARSRKDVDVADADQRQR